MWVFQFTASYEADQKEIMRMNINYAFQFTASYEADPLSHDINVVIHGLSIHSLIRG